jgi:putative membrane protein
MGAYPWIKAFHLVFVVTWFAALFYLPRLFVYHAMTNDEPGNARFKTMERKLYRGIMTPSAALAVAFGIALLALQPGWLNQGWMHAKLLLVGALAGYHMWCGRLVRTFAADANRRGDLWYRWFNEAPVLVLIAVMILAVVKPF